MFCSLKISPCGNSRGKCKSSQSAIHKNNYIHKNEPLSCDSKQTNYGHDEFEYNKPFSKKKYYYHYQFSK